MLTFKIKIDILNEQLAKKSVKLKYKKKFKKSIDIKEKLWYINLATEKSCKSQCIKKCQKSVDTKKKLWYISDALLKTANDLWKLSKTSILSS